MQLHLSTHRTTVDLMRFETRYCKIIGLVNGFSQLKLLSFKLVQVTQSIPYAPVFKRPRVANPLYLQINQNITTSFSIGYTYRFCMNSDLELILRIKI